MSNPISEPPFQTGSPSNPADAKAQAKAAKAYAKAMRPWYKKKRVIVPAGLVALTIAAGAGSSSEQSSSSSDSTSAGGTNSAKTSDGGKSGRVGQPLTNAGTTYEVTNVRTSDTVGSEFLGAKADGVFVIVSLELTNNKDETKTFSEASAKIRTTDGKEYETSSDGIMAFGDQSLLLKEIHPDLTTRGKVAFDLPPSKLDGSKLVIEDIWGSGEVTVDLGL